MLELAGLLFLVGLVLVVVEIFVPSMGLLAIMAGISFLGSVIAGFMESTNWGLGILGATIVAVPLIVIVGFRVLPVTPIGRRLILDAPDRSDAERGGDVSTEPLHDLLGREGVAVSKLRPAGIVEIDGNRLDVITEGDWIDSGLPVVVVNVEGNRAVVRLRDDAATEEKS